jgi:hypothetical protein
LKFLLSLFALFATAAHGVLSIAPMSRMFLVRNYTYNDNFYSTSPSQIDDAINTYGYQDKQHVFFVEQYHRAASLPLHRLFGYYPAVDHFYTIKESDYNIARYTYGYADEGYEGALLTTPTHPGMVPIYRLANFYAATSDVVHWYGHNTQERAVLLNQGWSDEGIEGYAWPVPFANQPVDSYWQYAVVSATVKFGTDLWVTVPSMGDPQDTSRGFCGGTAEVYRDGAYYRSIAFDQNSWQVLPTYPSSQVYGCRFNMMTAVPSGLHTFRIEFSGFSGKSVTITYEAVIPPYTHEDVYQGG